MIKEKILGKFDGESEEETERNMLEDFGFIWITNIGTRADGSILIDSSITEREGKEGELWVDWTNKRILFYTFGYDPTFVEGEFTKEEEKKWYK